MFEFGSVALRTYLPDGDIDCAIFFHGEFDPLWIPTLLGALHKEAQESDSEFPLNNVNWINAEVCAADKSSRREAQRCSRERSVVACRGAMFG